MPQSTVLEGATSGEIRISPDGARIYQAGSDGIVRVYDTLTGALVSEYDTGGSLGAMDLSPSGELIIALDTQDAIMYYIDLLTFGNISAVAYETAPDGGLLTDISIFSNQTALVVRSEPGDSFWPVQRLNINTGVFINTDSVSAGAILSRVSVSESGEELVLISEPGLGATVFERSRGVILETSGNTIDPIAQAVGGQTYALADTYGNVIIRGIGVDLFIDLREPDMGTIRDLEFSDNLEFFYVLGQSGSTIYTFRTSDWSFVESFATGASFDDASPTAVTLLVDPRGQFFTIHSESDADFLVIENPGAPTIEGTEFPDQLFGTLFGDVIFALGSNDEVDAGGGADIIHGGAGYNRIEGGSNVDTVVVSGNFADYSVTQIGLGRFEIVDGGDPNFDGVYNDVTGVEFVQFDDQTIRLLRGEGVSVEFETSNPAIYQSAMNAIRDFDGNALGGNGSWLRIGSADVNGDGDIDQILVNDAIGRFATVGTAPDGLVYFQDYSWAGETRVAGIYIDPLVQSGDVVAGSDNDSQRRYQNDLQIENINRVLGGDDYDGDGVWEVYFALTDGTAYLRALMHEDGNIRYANYQSEQEVIDYLTANGYDDSTFGDWFTSTQAAEASVVFAQSAGAPLPLAAPEVIQPRPSEDWQAEYFG